MSELPTISRRDALRSILAGTGGVAAGVAGKIGVEGVVGMLTTKDFSGGPTLGPALVAEGMIGEQTVKGQDWRRLEVHHDQKSGRIEVAWGGQKDWLFAGGREEMPYLPAAEPKCALSADGKRLAFTVGSNIQTRGRELVTLAPESINVVVLDAKQKKGFVFPIREDEGWAMTPSGKVVVCGADNGRIIVETLNENGELSVDAIDPTATLEASVKYKEADGANLDKLDHVSIQTDAKSDQLVAIVDQNGRTLCARTVKVVGHSEDTVHVRDEQYGILIFQVGGDKTALFIPTGTYGREGIPKGYLKPVITGLRGGDHVEVEISDPNDGHVVKEDIIHISV